MGAALPHGPWAMREPEFFMRLARASHASRFQIHILASVPGKVTLGVGYLIEGTHAQQAFHSGLRN
jgi:hypothetical protein